MSELTDVSRRFLQTTAVGVTGLAAGGREPQVPEHGPKGVFL
jgi:hypothetical protein